ncbi:MAG TPA: GNAT family N-acetyltransferase [Tepidisphaeraceae bacterium]|nr:GNAT family N-acetyltransferase [Tepidisphaeraceae bacterium]
MHLTEKLSHLGIAVPHPTLIFSHWKASLQPRRFAATDGLVAHWHESWPEDPQVIESWNQLCQSNPKASAFHTPAWQFELAKPFLRARRFRLLTLWRGGQLVGTLPVRIDAHGILHTPGSILSDYLDPLISVEDSFAAWKSLFYAMNHLPGIDVNRLVIHNCRPECMDQTALQVAAAEARFTVQSVPSEQVCRVTLPGSWEEYLATLDARDRKELRRKLRNAQTKAGAELAISETQDDVQQACERTLELVQRAGGNKGLKARWTFKPMFKHTGAELVAWKRLRVYELRLNGEYAAGLICLRSASGPMLWTIGHDAKFSAFSPGIVLMGLALQHSITEGMKCFDMLRGSPRYKSEFGARSWPIHNVTLQKERATN